jgi:Flp pilus assembly pilin Flp
MHINQPLARLVREEKGTEVLEYALILGLIVVATIAAITVVGSSVLARWNSVSGASL